MMKRMKLIYIYTDMQYIHLYNVQIEKDMLLYNMYRNTIHPHYPVLPKALRGVMIDMQRLTPNPMKCEDIVWSDSSYSFFIVNYCNLNYTSPMGSHGQLAPFFLFPFHADFHDLSAWASVRFSTYQYAEVSSTCSRKANFHMGVSLSFSTSGLFDKPWLQTNNIKLETLQIDNPHRRSTTYNHIPWMNDRQSHSISEGQPELARVIIRKGPAMQPHLLH
jgi:hypothetical protein